MPDHHHIAAGGNPRPKGQQFLPAQLFEGLRHIYSAVMGIGQRIPVAWEVLQRGCHAAAVKAPDRLRDQFSRLCEIVAVSPVADDRIVRIRPHIRHRSQVGVKSQHPHIRSNGVGVLPRGFRPLVPIPEHRPDICRTHRTHQPVDAPAFLVAGQYERYFGIALGVGQHFTYLLPAFQVGTAVYQAAHRHINKRLPCGFSGRCYTGNAGEQFRAENQHLAYLIAQRHPCQNIVYTAPGDRGPAALRRLALTFRNA